MNKKFAILVLAALMAAVMAAPAFAAGFMETGGYTVTDPRYTLEADEAVLEYNKDVTKEEDSRIDYTEIYSGSNLYVPIYVDSNDWDSERQATAKQIKDDNVQVSYVDVVGGRYIESVTIVDGKKEKDAKLNSGAYVKIKFVDNYSAGSRSHIQIKIVLSVNKVSYQESRVILECDISNRLEYINDNSVYGAQVPTTFKVYEFYDGSVTFDLGDGAKYSTTVKRDKKYTIDLSRDVDYDIDLLYPDAYLQFYNFRGVNDTFESVGKLQLPIDTKKFKDSTGQSRVYAYEVVNGTQLKALGNESASYDSKTQVLTINTQTLGYYVLSNEKLKQTIEVDPDDTFQSGYAEATVDEETSEAQIQDAVQRQPQQESATGTPTQITNDTVINAQNVNGGENPPTAPCAPSVVPAVTLAAISGVALILMKRKSI